MSVICILALLYCNKRLKDFKHKENLEREILGQATTFKSKDKWYKYHSSKMTIVTQSFAFAFQIMEEIP